MNGWQGLCLPSSGLQAPAFQALIDEKMKAVTRLGSAFVAGSYAVLASNLVSLHRLESVTLPHGWKIAGHSPPGQRLQFHVGLSSAHEGLFEQTLYNVSDPSHDSYGKYLDQEDINELLRPDDDTSNAVLLWLGEAGIASQDIKKHGDWIEFVGTTAQAEALLNTTFNLFHSKESGQQTIRTLQYSIPEGLLNHIDTIQPTTKFPQIRADMQPVEDLIRRTPAVDNSSVDCNLTITPACLKALYRIPDVPYVKNSKSGFAAFANFLEEYPRYSDLKTFEAKYAPYAVGQNFTWTSVNSGQLNQSYPGQSNEANLDVQYLLSTAFPIPIEAYSTGGRAPLVPDLDQPNANKSSNEPYLEWLLYMRSLPNNRLPHTVSISYDENEQSVPEAYRQRVCRMFGELGARGVSVLISSGDSGVGSACQTNDGKNTTRFLPNFPSSCPYVTSVGGTRHINPEKAFRISSGGFSDTFPTPWYQKQAVENYLTQLGNRWKGLYNPHGRGFPDVAAQSVNFMVFDKGELIAGSGTSASTPVFAGIVALLNAKRAGNGQVSLGFLNPWLYSRGFRGLNDITEGGSKGCTGEADTGLPAPVVPFASWNATVGWDPVTGLGTPDYPNLLRLI
ncbi:Tripeptidyl-peptidase SED2 [Pseudocercospora fuligena]|uniref:tripeptidyl-peptidase II n=1 Tax=Pseudocercospora fuligena TaxID=685502 RepID=A0A8H6R9A1_9PEZI|nr:Tripeptidyl-peptidase SED2 [Pseudocercospora fuligena]